MKTSELDYHLPKNLIANFPVSPRDHSKLMVIDKKSKTIQHKKFFNIIDHLTDNDVLVLNQTKVFPARFFGQKETGGKVEILLHKNTGIHTWEALTKPGVNMGQKVICDGFKFTVKAKDGLVCEIEVDITKDELLKKLYKIGVTPIPPYIHSKDSEKKLRDKYQTVYAKDTGSVAAPTAGFHFTKDLLKKIKQKGVQIEYVTLHVGMGTFAPIKSDNLEDHDIHSEFFEVSEKTFKNLNEAKKAGKRIIAVGTTTTRVLESLPQTSGETKIFIYPPYKFKFVDALITNFHLPQSSLIALVWAFGSKSLMKKAYLQAIKNKYRFYSFGDSSFIF